MNFVDIDDDLKSDLMGGFEDAFNQIEIGLTQLLNAPDPAIVNEMFRAIHSVKGNATMVHNDAIVDFTHQIENVLSRLRDQELTFSIELSEAIQVGMDRLRDLHHQELLGKHFEHLDVVGLGAQFNRIAQSPEADTVRIAKEILGLSDDDDSPLHDSPIPTIELSDKQASDLAFFQELSLQLDKRSEYWEGRSIQCFTWAHKLNQIGGNAVSYEQLSAACYLHDFGMSLVPDGMLNQQDPFSAKQNALLHPHPDWGYKLLKQLSGWDEAATIVQQHHECIDGTGYPNQLKGEAIHDGAKILAIVDAFFSMISGRPDRSVRRTALRAVSEINARKDTQFCAVWVDHFNSLLKEEMRAGHI